MRGRSLLTPPVARRLPAFVRQRLGSLSESDGDASSASSTVEGLRRRRPGDLAACVRLGGLASAGGVYRPASRAWLSAEEVLDAWVVERQGELLGHVAISDVGGDPLSALRWREVTGHDPGELVAVSRLFVRQRVRGQGIGTALLEVALDHARALGRLPVVEAVGAGAEELALYERQGWRLAAMYSASERADGHDVHFYVAPPRTSG
jgi:GNAT superfamily N-acetyltransferase